MAAVYITGDQSESVKVLAAIKVFSSHRFNTVTHVVPPFTDRFDFNRFYISRQSYIFNKLPRTQVTIPGN